MNLNDGIHYNWIKTLSYDADVTMVIGAPNLGKTYGIRGHCLINRYLKKGLRFVEVTRTSATRDAIKGGYFDRLAHEPELKGCDFRCSKNEFLIKQTGGKWETCGYIVSMAEVQSAKQRTFDQVESIIEDEAIIERIDRLHTYKRNEWDLLSRIVDSCAREDYTDEGRARPHVYLLGNAVDLLNPYFQIFGIKGKPPYGYSWHNGKTCLLHMVEPDGRDDERRRGTLAGRMGSITGYAQETYSNAFREDTRYIQQKPRRAKFMMGIKYLGQSFGIWVDYTEGFYYVTGKIPRGEQAVYSLTREDDTPNMIAARRTSRALRGIVDFYYMGAVLFESVRVREGFLDAMRMFGL